MLESLKLIRERESQVIVGSHKQRAMPSIHRNPDAPGVEPMLTCRARQVSWSRFQDQSNLCHCYEPLNPRSLYFSFVVVVVVAGREAPQ
jgi:hypothetical protein